MDRDTRWQRDPACGGSQNITIILYVILCIQNLFFSLPHFFWPWPARVKAGLLHFENVDTSAL